MPGGPLLRADRHPKCLAARYAPVTTGLRRTSAAIRVPSVQADEPTGGAPPPPATRAPKLWSRWHLAHPPRGSSAAKAPELPPERPVSPVPRGGGRGRVGRHPPLLWPRRFLDPAGSTGA